MKTLIGVALALTFIGAACQSANPLTRSCPGSTVQTAQYLVTGNCGDGTPRVIQVSASVAGECMIAVDEPTDVGLPTVGYFSASPYQLLKGNWTLQTVAPEDSQGECNAETICASVAASADGSFTFTCAEYECETTGEDLEPTSVYAGDCLAHLTVFTGDAGVYNNRPDAAAPDAAVATQDAGALHDATVGQ
jgi:hypothetical protein